MKTNLILTYKNIVLFTQLSLPKVKVKEFGPYLTIINLPQTNPKKYLRLVLGKMPVQN